ncbi:hypothetical protein L1987_50913 [Smallanthus sonchifolius]|uniref:Uncharacterized protein n=1 Tax=Smallanthus sonchifolius TaxID=185202 RepID=A0ACB9EPM7_9ASTR|nr:hypothetical protein L1987_50913 [Smallanthus sonchifolius]
MDAEVLTEMACGLAESNQRFLWAVRPGLVSGSEWLELLPDGFVDVDQGVNASYVSFVWKIGLELERVDRGEIERVIKRVMVDDGEEMRVRVNDMKEMVKEALENRGSSQESLDSLVDFIMSY